MPQFLVLNLDSVSQGGVALPAIPFFFFFRREDTDSRKLPLAEVPDLGSVALCLATLCCEG